MRVAQAQTEKPQRLEARIHTGDDSKLARRRHRQIALVKALGELPVCCRKLLHMDLHSQLLSAQAGGVKLLRLIMIKRINEVNNRADNSVPWLSPSRHSRLELY